MKLHTPLFIIGLLVFVTPFIGLTGYLEDVIFAAYGAAIMILVSSIRVGLREKSEIQNDK